MLSVENECCGIRERKVYEHDAKYYRKRARVESESRGIRPGYSWRWHGRNYRCLDFCRARPACRGDRTKVRRRGMPKHCLHAQQENHSQRQSSLLFAKEPKVRHYPKGLYPEYV